MNKKGQSRTGGKPLGWRKPEGTRQQHQVRAYPDEWLIIKDFADIVKKGDRTAAQNFVERFKAH